MSQPKTKDRIWRYGLLLFWLLFIFFASTSSFSADNTSVILRPVFLWFFPNLNEAQLATIHFLTRKLAHFSEYAILAFLSHRALISSSRESLRRHWFLLTTLLVVVYSLLDEFHQSFVPSRTPSLYDSCIDIAGGVTVLLIFTFYNQRQHRRSPA
jgi:VanZ family protein